MYVVIRLAREGESLAFLEEREKEECRLAKIPEILAFRECRQQESGGVNL